MKVALVHDWLTGMRGGERVLEGLCELFPEATLYTLIYNPVRVSSIISRMPVRTSFLQNFPAIFKYYRYFLPFFPKAIEQFDFKNYDLVISTSHCVAKGVKTPPSTCHICYCLTPMRYAWGFHGEYFGHWPPLIKKAINLVLKRLKKWDLTTSQRVNFFLAISENIAQKIKEIYGREVSKVIYPPVDTAFFTPLEKAISRVDHKDKAINNGNLKSPSDCHDRNNSLTGFTPQGNQNSKEYFLIVSALVPYKKIDLAIECFNRLGLPLLVIGEGPERGRLERLARSNIKFLGWQPKKSLRKYYNNARALIFPGEEDFGIVPLEAQAMGCPVIAYGKGGARETVIDGKTGLFFIQPPVESLIEAVKQFQNLDFDPVILREHALKFDRTVHLDKLKNSILEIHQEFKGEKVA